MVTLRPIGLGELKFAGYLLISSFSPFVAIKFTALVPREKIIRVSLEASPTEPLTSVEMPFLPQEEGEVQGDVTAGPE